VTIYLTWIRVGRGRRGGGRTLFYIYVHALPAYFCLPPSLCHSWAVLGVKLGMEGYRLIRAWLVGWELWL
jgi:hypothetical protein